MLGSGSGVLGITPNIMGTNFVAIYNDNTFNAALGTQTVTPNIGSGTT
jgi:hypothetical protein